MIVRNMTNRNAKQQYELKKHDIIKLGRVKFKVKKIYIREAEEEREMKIEQMRRRESDWRRKEIQRLKEASKKMRNKRQNSDNLQAI